MPICFGLFGSVFTCELVGGMSSSSSSSGKSANFNKLKGSALVVPCWNINIFIVVPNKNKISRPVNNDKRIAFSEKK